MIDGALKKGDSQAARFDQRHPAWRQQRNDQPRKAGATAKIYPELPGLWVCEAKQLGAIGNMPLPHMAQRRCRDQVLPGGLGDHECVEALEALHCFT